jgi:PST family polysaccharide transporter
LSTSSPDIEPRFGAGRLARGGTAVVAGTLMQKAAGLVLAAALGRLLSVEDFGRLSFAIGFATFFEIFADLGIDMATTSRLAAADKAQEGHILGSALALKAITVAGTVVIAGGVSFVYDQDLRVLALVSLLMLVADVPSTFALGLAARVELTAIEVIQSLGTIAGVVALIAAAAWGAGPGVLVGIQVASSLVSGFALGRIAKRRLGLTLSASRDTMWQLARAAVPVAVSVLAVVVYVKIDTLMLAAMTTTDEVARYAAPVKLVEGLAFLPTAAAAVVLPAVSRYDATGQDRSNELMRLTFRYIGAVLLPVAAFGTVAGGPLLAFIFGRPYAGAGSVLALLLWAYVFACGWAVARQSMIARRQNKALTVLPIAGAVVNVGLNLVLIPAHGALGAAVASLVSYALPIVLGLWWPGVAELFWTFLRVTIRPTLAAVLMLVALYALPGRLPVMLAASVVVAPAALLISGALGVSDVRRVLVSFRHSPMPSAIQTRGDDSC